jgi:hypothetical protein
LAGVISTKYIGFFGFACGRFATMWMRKKSLVSGFVVGFQVLSFRSLMEVVFAPNSRVLW